MPGWLLCVSKPFSETLTAATPALLGDHLRRRADRVAERRRGKLGREDVLAVQIRRRLHDVLLDLEDVGERGVAPLARGRGKPRLAQELLGVGQRDRARAAGKRPHFGAAHDHPVGGERRRA